MVIVEQVMALTLGGGFSRTLREPMCGCTELGHDDVRQLMRAKALKSIPAVMQELGWKTSCGCSKPATTASTTWPTPTAC